MIRIKPWSIACSGLMMKSATRPTTRPIRMQSSAAITVCTLCCSLALAPSILGVCFFAISLRLLCLLFGAGHIQAKLLHRGRLGVKLTDDFAFIHHKNAVGQVHDFVQFQADEQ